MNKHFLNQTRHGTKAQNYNAKPTGESHVIEVVYGHRPDEKSKQITEHMFQKKGRSDPGFDPRDRSEETVVILDGRRPQYQEKSRTRVGASAPDSRAPPPAAAATGDDEDFEMVKMNGKWVQVPKSSLPQQGGRHGGKSSASSSRAPRASSSDQHRASRDRGDRHHRGDRGDRGGSRGGDRGGERREKEKRGGKDKSGPRRREKEGGDEASPRGAASKSDSSSSQPPPPTTAPVYTVNLPEPVLNCLPDTDKYRRLREAHAAASSADSALEIGKQLVGTDDELAANVFKEILLQSPRHIKSIATFAIFMDCVKGNPEQAEKLYLLAARSGLAVHVKNYAQFVRNIRKEPERADQIEKNMLKK